MENNNNATASAPSEAIGKISGWYLALGILLVVSGIAAMFSPVATTFVTNVFLGWFLIFGGIIQFFAAIVHRKDSNVWIGMLMGILAFILGVMMVTNVYASIVSITLLFGGFFLVDGVVKTFQSLAKKPEHWGWMLTSGLISILLAIVIFMNFFASTVMILGIFVGVYMLFAGIEIIVLYYASRK
jgi:uncharacterized membrane protein HdeD (DUF308 family)